MGWDDAVPVIGLGKHHPIIKIFARVGGFCDVADLEKTNTSGGAGARACTDVVAFCVTAKTSYTSMGNTVGPWNGRASVLEEGQPSGVSLLGSIGSPRLTKLLLFASVCSYHTVGCTEVLWVLRVPATVLVLESNPQVAVFLPVDGTEVLHGEGSVSAGFCHLLVVSCGGGDPGSHGIRIGTRRDRSRVLRVKGIDEGIKKPFVAANGPAIMFESVH